MATKIYSRDLLRSRYADEKESIFRKKQALCVYITTHSEKIRVMNMNEEELLAYYENFDWPEYQLCVDRIDPDTGEVLE